MSTPAATTIFNTPILSELLHSVGMVGLRLAGWKIDGKLPDLPKFILIGAPHTSNWDFVLFLGMAFSLRVNARFMGKAELFRWPFGAFFRYCGGVPVDRKRPQGLVEQSVAAIRAAKRFILVITPEGTRREVAEWKRGFYHIAKGAGIPIVIGIVDGKHKTVRVGQVFHPTDDMEADMKSIQRFYVGATGLKPRKKYIPLDN